MCLYTHRLSCLWVSVALVHTILWFTITAEETRFNYISWYSWDWSWSHCALIINSKRIRTGNTQIRHYPFITESSSLYGVTTLSFNVLRMEFFWSLATNVEFLDSSWCAACSSMHVGPGSIKRFKFRGVLNQTVTRSIQHSLQNILFGSDPDILSRGWCWVITPVLGSHHPTLICNVVGAWSSWTIWEVWQQAWAIWVSAPTRSLIICRCQREIVVWMVVTGSNLDRIEWTRFTSDVD